MFNGLFVATEHDLKLAKRTLRTREHVDGKGRMISVLYFVIERIVALLGEFNF